MFLAGITKENDHGALDQPALTELHDALRSGGDLDFMREAMQLVLQALLDLEATEKIGGAPYERSDARTTHRNGSRSRLLSTKAGERSRFAEGSLAGRGWRPAPPSLTSRR